MLFQSSTDFVGRVFARIDTTVSPTISRIARARFAPMAGHFRAINSPVFSTQE